MGLTARILKRLDDGQPLVGRQKDEGHRGYAATNQRYGEKTRYHAIRRACPRERHQDPPKGRRCQRYGKEMSSLQLISNHAPNFVRGSIIIHKLSSCPMDYSGKL